MLWPRRSPTDIVECSMSEEVLGDVERSPSPSIRRTTIATWINYASTIAFYVLFAARFGAGRDASAYVIVLGICMAASGLVSSSLTSVAVPRLIDDTGRLVVRTVGLLVIVVLATAVAGVLLALLSENVAHTLAPLEHADPDLLAPLLAWGAVAFFIQAIVGVLSSLSLALGRPTVPAVAPALPSMVCCVYLAADRDPDVVHLLGLLAISGIAQIVLVAGSVGWRHKFGRAPAPGIGLTFLISFGSYVLLSALPAIERLAAGWSAPNGAAHYDYAMRSIAIGQQLLLGGVTMATLSEWSRVAARAADGRMAARLRRVLVTGALVLLLAAVVAGVAREDLVRISFQHGSFTAADTHAVAAILLLAVPGFWCEGVGLLIVPALAGMHRNRALAAVGAANFGIRVTAIAFLAPHLGPQGVALAYTITRVLLLTPLIMLAARAGLWSDMSVPVWRTGIVAAGTVMASAMVSIVLKFPTLLEVGAIVVVFIGLTWLARPLQAATVLR
jgi:peptidoglycan biosynthesis protein MviN/MurJ (putative lipid II flippase)